MKMFQVPSQLRKKRPKKARKIAKTRSKRHVYKPFNGKHVPGFGNHTVCADQVSLTTSGGGLFPSDHTHY
jgi:hypothetical protein